MPLHSLKHINISNKAVGKAYKQNSGIKIAHNVEIKDARSTVYNRDANKLHKLPSNHKKFDKSPWNNQWKKAKAALKNS